MKAYDDRMVSRALDDMAFTVSHEYVKASSFHPEDPTNMNRAEQVLLGLRDHALLNVVFIADARARLAPEKGFAKNRRWVPEARQMLSDYDSWADVNSEIGKRALFMLDPDPFIKRAQVEAYEDMQEIREGVISPARMTAEQNAYYIAIGGLKLRKIINLPQN